MIVTFIIILLCMIVVMTVITTLIFIYTPSAFVITDGKKRTKAELVNVSLNFVTSVLSTAGGAQVYPVSAGAIAWTTVIQLAPLILVPVIIFIFLREKK